MKKMIRIALFLLAFTLFGVLACSPPGDNSVPVFRDAWIRPLPPAINMTAGFGTLHNPGPQAIEFTEFSSPAFGDVSLHRTEMVDGMSGMREVETLSIPPGGTVELAPGGYHLMLMMPLTPLEEGRMVMIEMKSADGRSFSFQAAVERR